jgi:hypothetical protein
LQIASRERITQLENDARPRKRHQFTNDIGFHDAIFSKKSVDLFQFVLDLARLATSEQYKEIERILVELEFSLLCALLNYLGGFFFPSTSTGIEPVENLHLRSFEQRLIKRAAFVDLSRADQKRDTRSETAVD